MEKIALKNNVTTRKEIDCIEDKLTNKKITRKKNRDKKSYPINENNTMHIPVLSKDIAIVGISCRFPNAENYREFWKNLEKGRNSIGEITPDRWSIEEWYSRDINEPNKSISKWCGLVKEIDKFDNQFFNISPREANSMDPQQRLLLEAAAGVASLIKVLLMLKHKKICQTLNVKILNPIIHFENSPFIPALKLTEWDHEKTPRRASVSSMGMGGMNSHIIVEEYIEQKKQIKQENGNTKYPLIISAKSKESLTETIKNWRVFLHKIEEKKLSIKDICCTLCNGREFYDFRFAGGIKSIQDLKQIISSGIRYSHISKTKWIFVIKSFKIDGYKQLSFLFDYPVFKQNLEKVIEEVKGFNLSKNLKNYFEEQWTRKNSDFFRFLTLYVYSKGLLELGISADILSGFGHGLFIVFVLAKMVSFKDACLYIMHKKRLQKIKINRPLIPFYDVKTNTMLLPCLFHEEYVMSLLKNTHIDQEDFFLLVQKSILLETCQWTFKKYLEKWNSTLKEYNLDIVSLLNKFSKKNVNISSTKESLVLFIILASCLLKLNKKWNLSGKSYNISQNVKELLLLIFYEVIDEKTFLSLCLADHVDYKKVSALLNLNQDKIPLGEKNYILCDSVKKLVEIKDKETWIQDLMKTDFKPEQINSIIPGAGEIHTSDNEISQCVYTNVPNNKDDFITFLYTLWEKGINIKWEKIYEEGSYKKYPLPTYVFNKKSFWIKEITESKEDKKITGKEQQKNSIHRLKPGSSNKDGWHYKRVFSPADPVIADHVICGKRIIPGAFLIEMCKAAAEQAINDHVNLGNIIIQNPVIINENTEIQAMIEKDKMLVRLFCKNKLICKALFTCSHTFFKEILDLNDFNTFDSPKIKTLYTLFRNMGYEYGNGLQVIQKLLKNEDSYLFVINAPTINEGHIPRFNPRMLDGTFQAGICTLLIKAGTLDPSCMTLGQQNTLYVPYIVKTLNFAKDISDNAYVYIKHEDIKIISEDIWISYSVHNKHGECVLQVQDLVLKKVKKNFLGAEKNLYSKLKAITFLKPFWEPSIVQSGCHETSTKNCVVIHTPW